MIRENPDRSIQNPPTERRRTLMAYTPELSQLGSATLRRLAWYMGKPMTKSLEMLIGMTAMKMAEIRPGEVCSKCRDDRICAWCPFHTPSTFYRNL